MPQLSLYIDDKMMEQMRSCASSEGLSLSRYAANAIRDCIDSPSRTIGEGYWDRLYGSLAEDKSFVRPAQLETKPIQSFDAL